MSITLFSTRFIGDRYLFRNNNVTIEQISANSVLYNYLYDIKNERLRTEQNDSQLYQLNNKPIYAIRCIDSEKYANFGEPNDYGISDYISILTNLLLERSTENQSFSLNLILHQGDIHADAFNIKEFSKDDVETNGCYWISSEEIKNHLLTQDVVDKLNSKRITINLALFSHQGGIFEKILKRDIISEEEIDELFAQNNINTNYQIEDERFLIPDAFTVVNKKEYALSLPQESDIISDELTIHWNEQHTELKTRIVVYKQNYFNSFNHKPEGNTIYFQEKYIQEVMGSPFHIIPTIHIFTKDAYKNDNPRFVDVTDCSIWNFNCQFGDQERLKEILEAIAINTQNELYNLSVTYEYADFTARLLKNSYIASFGDGSHKIVSPFLFHSEKRMKEKLNNNHWESLQHDWRFLLVDDHAVDGMGYANNTKNKTKFGKAHIIANCFKNAGLQISIECYDLDAESNNPFATVPCQKSNGSKLIRIDCVKTIDRAYYLVKSSRYDIILLDYKLQYPEFGYKLLEEINNHHQELTEKGQIGPNGRFFFMFISAYTTAVSQRFLREGYRISTKSWFIDKGACPTNTPYLFLYSLKRLMDKRLESLMKHEKALSAALEIDSNKKPIITVIDFLNSLYSPAEEVRHRCKNGFNAFLILRSTYDRLKYDVYDGITHKKKGHEFNERFVASEENESKLAHSMFPDVICYNNTFWEHLQHLIYLSAYGTNRQWPEMWEELQSVSDILNYAEEEITKYKSKDSQAEYNTDHAIVKLIRNYILNLKHQNSR